jgi:ribonuclease HI
MRKVEIYSDGSCLVNPGGAGGYAAIILVDGVIVREVSGYEPSTTNNRQELRGVIEGLKALNSNSVVTVYSDSKYVVDGASKWIYGWIKKGFAGIKNPDLWRDLLEAQKGHTVTYRWVRGHNGNPMNERAG